MSSLPPNRTVGFRAGFEQIKIARRNFMRRAWLRAIASIAGRELRAHLLGLTCRGCRRGTGEAIVRATIHLGADGSYITAGAADTVDFRTPHSAATALVG